MFGALKKIVSRVDFYASHCYARIKSCIPLSLFYAFDGVSGGLIKNSLKPVLGGTIPAVSTFMYYVYALTHKAKESYDLHPESINLHNEQEKFTETASIIRIALKKHENESHIYLESLGLTESQRDFLLKKSPTDLEKLKMYDIFHHMYATIHPHHIRFLHNFIDSLLHGITHLNEYLLLKYFAEINLLDFEEFSAKNVAGLLILMLGTLSAYQTYTYNLQPKKPSSDEMSKTIRHDFRLYRNQSNLNSMTVSYQHDDTLEVSNAVDALAAIDAHQTCTIGH